MKIGQKQAMKHKVWSKTDKISQNLAIKREYHQKLAIGRKYQVETGLET